MKEENLLESTAGMCSPIEIIHKQEFYSILIGVSSFQKQKFFDEIIDRAYQKLCQSEKMITLSSILFFKQECVSVQGIPST